MSFLGPNDEYTALGLMRIFFLGKGALARKETP